MKAGRTLRKEGYTMCHLFLPKLSQCCCRVPQLQWSDQSQQSNKMNQNSSDWEPISPVAAHTLCRSYPLFMAFSFSSALRGHSLPCRLPPMHFRAAAAITPATFAHTTHAHGQRSHHTTRQFVRRLQGAKNNHFPLRLPPQSITCCRGQSSCHKNASIQRLLPQEFKP